MVALLRTRCSRLQSRQGLYWDFVGTGRTWEVIGAFHTADSLYYILIRAPAQCNGFHATLLPHEFAEYGARGGTVSIVHDDDVLRGERLPGDIGSLQVARYVYTAAVVGCQNVTQIPTNYTGEIVAMVFMGTVFLVP